MKWGTDRNHSGPNRMNTEDVIRISAVMERKNFVSQQTGSFPLCRCKTVKNNITILRSELLTETYNNNCANIVITRGELLGMNKLVPHLVLQYFICTEQKWRNVVRHRERIGRNDAVKHRKKNDENTTVGQS